MEVRKNHAADATLRKDAERDEEFLEFVQFRGYGYDASFGKTKYRYADFDGWQYWTMGFVLDGTILINRSQRLSSCSECRPDETQELATDVVLRD